VVADALEVASEHEIHALPALLLVLGLVEVADPVLLLLIGGVELFGPPDIDVFYFLLRQRFDLLDK